MKVKCKVCNGWFERDNVYCDHCAAKYGSERSIYDIDFFEDQRSYTADDQAKIDKKQAHNSSQKHSSTSTHEKSQDHTDASSPIPNLDTLRDLKKPFENKNQGPSQHKNKSPFHRLER